MQETTICNDCMNTVILHFYYDTNRYEGVCPNCGITVDEDGKRAKEIIDYEYEKYYRDDTEWKPYFSHFLKNKIN